jgi:hypothetical protein
MQAPQQGIEPLLYCFPVAALAAQGTNELGNHLFEDGHVIGKGGGVKRWRRHLGWLRRSVRKWRVRAHAYKTHEGALVFDKIRKILGKVTCQCH